MASLPGGQRSGTRLSRSQETHLLDLNHPHPQGLGVPLPVYPKETDVPHMMINYLQFEKTDIYAAGT